MDVGLEPVSRGNAFTARSAAESFLDAPFSVQPLAAPVVSAAQRSSHSAHPETAGCVLSFGGVTFLMRYTLPQHLSEMAHPF